MRRGRLKDVFSALLMLAVLAGAGSAAWWNWAAQPYAGEDGAAGEVVFIIEPGMDASQVAQELAAQRLIRSGFVFRFWSGRQNADSQLRAGEYRLSARMTPREIMTKILEGPAIQGVKVTIPEGYTTEQIIDLFAQQGLGSKEDYREAIAGEFFDYSFLADLPLGPQRLDGFLFPDTYFLAPEAAPKTNIKRLLKRFEQEVTPEVLTRLAEMKLTLREWVNLAALVEKEAGTDADRPLIAGIFLNRLRLQMPLQSCATIQYILGTSKYILSLEDIQVESPYNTYKYPGLPPGPIANPGHASLNAVLNSIRSDYLYFLATPKGETIYAKTHQEHLRNQAKYLN